MTVRVLLVVSVLLAWSSHAHALPRFAARNGASCSLCHINPSGGGIRNAYGRNVFATAWLPLGTGPAREAWDHPDSDTDDSAPKGTHSGGFAFDPEINDSLVFGADFLAAYIYSKPDRGPAPGAKPDVTSSFFLMQGDLYHAATLNDHVTLVFDVGIYSGFEAWGLLSVLPAGEPNNLQIKVGRFMPAFGIRDVNHQLYTRDGIGLGATDKDSGIELTGTLGPAMLQVAVLNGTLGDKGLDTHGSKRSWLEKALSARASVRGRAGKLRVELGSSFYYSPNTDEANPLLAGSVDPARTADVSEGVDNVRAGGFLMSNLGRFSYLAELVSVHDSFKASSMPSLTGYASYQELSFVPLQGLDLIGTFEFADPDVQLGNDRRARAGLVAELFPWRLTELRTMVRRSWDRANPTGGAWDVVVFTHLFF